MARVSTLFIALLIFGKIDGQSYTFQKYAEQDGLTNRFIYTLDQDERGNLMIGTGEGLFTYDGFVFSEISVKQGLADNMLTCSEVGKDQTVWFGHNDGTITRYQNQHFEHFDISGYTQSRINDIFEDEEGVLWVITQNDGILKKMPDGRWIQLNKGIEEFNLYAFETDSYNNIWLGTDIGLIKVKITSSDILEYEWVEEIIETKVSCLTKNGSSIYVGTDDSGIYRLTPTETGGSIEAVLHKGEPLEEFSINSIFVPKDESLWLCTNNHGLIKLIEPDKNEYSKIIRYLDKKNLKTSSVRTCMTDREGTMWIGTMGDGLLKLTDDHFSINSFHQSDQTNHIYSIFERNDSIWCGAHGKIYLSIEEPINVVDSIDAENLLSPYPVTAIYRDNQNRVWAGNTVGELKILNSKDKKMKSVPLGTELQQQQINDIKGLGDIVYVATNYGLFLLKEQKLIQHLTIQSGLPHNVVKSLYCDNAGRLWICCNSSQLTYIENTEIKNIKIPFENILFQISCITEDDLGNLWIATEGNGVIKMSPNDEISLLNKYSGLYSDFCYSIVSDHRGQVWIGHHGAMSKIDIMNNKIDVIDPSMANEIDFIANAVTKLSSGVILFGINEGLLKYEPDKDLKNEKEPILHFTFIEINDSTQKDLSSVTLPYGEYKFSFNFIGISLKNPLNVSYQYILEGYETEWSDVTYSSTHDYKLSYGEYTFKVKSFNKDGYGGTQIIEYKIFIDKPFWLKSWFIVGTILTLILLIRYLILRREGKLREAQQMLKIALDERTKEVVEQKELLEEKNKDITDSIQYARNIQNAMLPSRDALNKYFPESLVYYKPRDIVSGDFYKVEQFEKTVVVSCADCTGHGVPGAFMSLIGSSLLKEVSRNRMVQSAGDVLMHLNNELNRILHKQSEKAIHDGMDIAVFDYNVETRVIKIASANRPVIFFHKNVWHELRGDRISIGEKSGDDLKSFTQHEFKAEPGDLIYLFSDGITDQFGGSNNKKLKRSGLLAWLKDIAHLTMSEQRQILKQNFKSWKGDREQLDDIILIGIRF